jgi:hypothetical protein
MKIHVASHFLHRPMGCSILRRFTTAFQDESDIEVFSRTYTGYVKSMTKTTDFVRFEPEQ